MDIGLSFDPDTLSADIALDGSDLATDDTLRTAAILSLFCDRRAEADDELPSQDGDRRGWWGDLPVDEGADDGRRDLIGSRLWLLSRAKELPETLNRAVQYAREALQWMIDDGVATKIDVTASWKSRGFLALLIDIDETSLRFDLNLAN